MNLRSVLALVMCCFFVTACEDRQGALQAIEDSVDVRTIHVTVDKVPVSVMLPGRIQATSLAEIRPRVDGIITAKLFEEGQSVKAGDTLYQIDPRLYESNLKSSMAALEQAKSALDIAAYNLERYKTLRQLDSVSEEDLETAKLNYDAQLANYELALSNLNADSLNLEYTKVLSPIDGVAGISNTPIGALVTANQSDPLTTVAFLDEVYVDLEQNALDWQNLQVLRHNGRLTSDSSTLEVTLFINKQEWPVKGRLISYNPVVNETSGSVSLRARFENQKHLLFPGMAVEAKVMVGIDPHAMVIPVQTVIRSPRGQTYVFVVASDNRVSRQEVTLGMLTEKGYEVVSGLEKGDEIVIDGLNSLRDGSLVRIVNYAGRQNR